MNNNDYTPKALREIWNWKDEIYKEVEHLNPKDALHEIMNKAEVVARELGFIIPTSISHTAAVAEKQTEYTATKNNK